jgi:hypothetical protein
MSGATEERTTSGYAVIHDQPCLTIIFSSSKRSNAFKRSQALDSLVNYLPFSRSGLWREGDGTVEEQLAASIPFSRRIA